MGLIQNFEAVSGIGADKIQEFAHEDCRIFHGETRRYVERGNTLNESEIVTYVRVLRRGDELGMDLKDASESIVEVLL